MAVTRIKNNQITDLTVNAAAKLQDYSITSGKIANNLTYGSDLTISGNLIVNGTTTTIDTIDLVVEDPLILLAKNQTGTPTLDIGYIGKRGTSDNIAMVWNEANLEFVTAFTSTELTNTTITISSYANFHTANLVAQNANVAGTANIGNLVIGNIVGDLTASGNISGANLLTSGLVSATGNVTGGNVTTSGAVSATGNVSGGNLIAATLVQGTTVSATGNLVGGNANITSAVNSATVSASGNIDGGNVNTAGQVSATGNVAGGNVSTAGQVSAIGNVSGGNVNAASGIFAATGYFTGNVDVLGNLNASIGVVYANSGIFYGNAITGNGAAYAGVPGFTPLNSNVVMQFGGNVNAYSQLNFENINNGTQASTDLVLTADNGTDSTNFVNLGIAGSNWDGTQPNSLGDALAPDAGYLYTQDGNLVVGTSNPAHTFNVIVGGPGAANVVAVFSPVGTDSANTTSGALTVKGGLGVTETVNAGNIGTPGYVSATGNVTGGNVNTAGMVSATGNVSGGNLTTAGIVSATGNVSGGNLATAGTVSATGNVTGGNVNTAGTVSATGNVAGGNLTTAGEVSATGNLTGGNVNTAGTVSATGNITGGNISTAGQISATGNITTLAKLESATLEVNGDALVAGNLVVQGNLTYINVDDLRVEDPIIQLGGGANGNVLTTNDGMDRGTFMAYYTTAVGNAFMGWDNSTGNMVIAGNVSIANNIVTYNSLGTLEAGNAYLESASVIGTVSGGNVTTAGLISATGNVTGGNINTAGQISATGNVNGGNVITAGLVQGATVSATGNLVGGNANITSAVNSATVSASGNIDGGNVNTAGQVSATGNVTGGNLYTAGAVSATGNITTAGKFIGDGSLISNISTTAGTALTNGTTNITTALNGNANVTIGGTSNVVVWSTAGEYITGLQSVTGNITGGNIATAGVISATGNINGGNLIAVSLVQGTTVSATGNLVGGNANITSAVNSATVSATGNIDGGNINTAGLVSAIGNLVGGNVSTAGLVTATGDVIGGNLATAGTVSATGNVTGGNINTAGLVSATGNVVGGNVSTAGVVTATGTITGGNISTAGQANLGNIRISGDTITGTNGQVLVNSAQGVVNFIVSGDSQANLLYTDATTDTVMIGTGTPTANAALKIGTSNSMIIPVGNVSQRPPVGVTGMLRFNTTTDQLEYYDSDSWTSAGTTFTVITDNQYNGDDVTTTFTLSTSSTTAATIVSINGVMQIPTTAYSVSGTSLVFTEAPASTDVIDARCLTTTSTIIGIQNTSGNAVIEGSATAAQFDVTGNLVPTANLTYDLGSPTNNWKSLYVGGNSIYLGSLVIKDSGSNQIGFYQADGTTPATVASSSVDTTRIANGTSNMSVISSGGNIQANVGGATIVKVTSLGIENGQANGVGNIGTSSTYFNTVFAKATSAQYADLAEMYAADQAIEPGTVVCFGGTEEIIVCDTDSCRRIAGVVSTNPSYLMNSALESQNPTAVALQGRVPVKVTGSVRKGDMMVAATQGRARAESNPQIGAVIGKALEDFDGENGIIEVVVGRL